MKLLTNKKLGYFIGDMQFDLFYFIMVDNLSHASCSKAALTVVLPINRTSYVANQGIVEIRLHH